jgi:hypothetical protein
MGSPNPDDLKERANRAYWETDAGVNHIADTLDASKSALYALIEPLETGDACDACGGPLVWENRTARTRGLGVCPGCVAGESPSGTPSPAARERAESTAPAPAGAAAGPGAGFAMDDARALGGAVLVGLGAGFLAAVMMLRKR